MVSQDPQTDLLRVRALFEGALDLPADEQSAYLEKNCAEEPALRAHVEKLLQHEREAASFLDQDAHQLAAREAGRPDDWVGRTVGDYRIVGLLGSGGSGVVFEAIQDSPHRRVALKMLQSAIPTPEVMQRFRLEAEVLGLLQHPGIAQVHRAGSFEEAGRDIPYVAMELVEDARPIHRFADEEGLDTEGRLRLFQQACAAVQFGHQKGIIHRDLKPGNLLVDRMGCVKVIDFGLAHVEDPALVCLTLVETRAGGLLGTLDYMSPEHVTGRTLDIDARSDVYSLGCVLFQLLTGEPPRDLRGLPIPAAVQKLQSEDPKVPADLPRELRWILVKALERAPERRYGSPRELLDDLERFLAHESVLAVRPTAIYQLSKFGRRHRFLLGASAAVLGALLFGLIRANGEARRAQAAEVLARTQEQVAQGVGDFLGLVFQSTHAYREGPEARVADMVEFALSELETVQEPVPRAILSALIGQGFLNLEQDGRALDLVEPAYRALLEQRGLEDAHTLHAGAVLADLLERRGDYAGSLELTLALLEAGEEALGENHRDVGYLRQNLAVVYGRLGREAEAETVLRTTLERLRAQGTQEPRSEIDLVFKLGQCLARQRRGDEASELLQEALALCDASGLEDGLYSTVIRMRIGLVHQSWGELDEAERLFRAGAQAFDELGGTPSNRFGIRANLAGTLIQRAHNGGPIDLEELAKWIDECGALLADVPGEPGSLTRSWLNLRTSQARLSGETELAVEVAEELVELSKAMFPDGDPSVVPIYTSLALALEAASRPEQALMVFEEGAGIAQTAFGAGSPKWRTLSRNHVRLLQRQGRIDDARALVQEIESWTPREAGDWPTLQDLAASLAGAETAP